MWFGRFRHIAWAIYFLALFGGMASVSYGQIGGKTAFEAPVFIEDAEDLDLTADGVMRDWIPDNIQGVAEPLKAIALSSSGLTLLPGQSPAGALEFTIKSNQGFFQGGFGVPVPSVLGASTATNPGNISLFTNLKFAACLETPVTSTTLQVVLECYPANSGSPVTYPKIYWNYSVAPGTTFQACSIDLHTPAQVQQSGALTVDQLLSQTRFLYFYCFAPVSGNQTMRFRIDDIALTSNITPVELNWFSLE